MLDIVEVIVVSTVEIVAEVLMLEGVHMSWVTMSSWLELVKFVSCIRRIAYECDQVKGCQVDWR
jgi:hypothetical protein